MRRAADKKTWNFAMLNGKAGKNQNKDPTEERQQEERPGDQQQPYQYWNLKDGWQAADPG